MSLLSANEMVLWTNLHCSTSWYSYSRHTIHIFLYEWTIVTTIATAIRKINFYVTDLFRFINWLWNCIISVCILCIVCLTHYCVKYRWNAAWHTIWIDKVKNYDASDIEFETICINVLIWIFTNRSLHSRVYFMNVNIRLRWSLSASWHNKSVFRQ